MKEYNFITIIKLFRHLQCFNVMIYVELNLPTIITISMKSKKKDSNKIIYKIFK